MPSASSLFLLFSILEKLLLKIFLELDETFWRFFIQQDTDVDQRESGGATPRAEAATGASWAHPTGGARLCPWGISSASPNAYKLPLTIKMSRRPLFSREVTRGRRHHKP